jgi:hypothetical protein
MTTDNVSIWTECSLPKDKQIASSGFFYKNPVHYLKQNNQNVFLI